MYVSANHLEVETTLVKLRKKLCFWLETLVFVVTDMAEDYLNVSLKIGSFWLKSLPALHQKYLFSLPLTRLENVQASSEENPAVSRSEMLKQFERGQWSLACLATNSFPRISNFHTQTLINPHVFFGD